LFIWKKFTIKGRNLLERPLALEIVFALLETIQTIRLHKI